MTSIRPIRESEGEAFLQLLCDVFSLDFNRAYDVFFTEPMFDLERKWALFEGPEMISILTTTPLQFGWGNAIGIAGVATRKERQREGHASRLLAKVLKESERRNEGAALLFARELTVYERNGFEAIDRVIRAPILTTDETFPEPMPFPQVRDYYDTWASAHPDRLRRDEKRWNYWNWHYRTCAAFGDGYLCHEPGVLREAIFSSPVDALPIPKGTDYYGTTFMADQLALPLGTPTVDFYLMGHNIPGIPQMYMTDQF